MSHNAQELKNANESLDSGSDSEFSTQFWKKKSYRCPKFDGNAKQTLEIRVERKRNVKVDELGEVSFGMLKLGELGEVSFGIYKLGE